LRRGASLVPLSVRYETSPAFRRVLERELSTNGYDLLICDFLQATANLPADLPCASLLFTHNVESRITRRQAGLAQGLAAKSLWLWQHALTTHYEAAETRRFDRVVAVSPSDREEFEQRFGLRSVREIPTGVDVEAFRPSGRLPDPDHVVFCGSMDWLPNEDAVRWFAAEVLPRIVAARPNAHLTVVGRNPTAALVEALERGAVRFTGRVDDVRPWLGSAACVVVPLRIGGGTRIKIYEALASERPVVSTGIGAEGLPIADGQHYLRADDAAAFADKVVHVLSRPLEARQLAETARRYVALHFGWDRAAEAFAAIGEEAVAAWAGRHR
jgi:glycosyltransferase involved in cell wall biosynthesis